MKLTREEIVELLNAPDAGAELQRRADGSRREVHGDVVHFRAILEFSNYCRRSCEYCGINCRMSGVERYRMTEADILSAAERIVDAGFRTVILQSGEDPELDPVWLSAVIDELKRVHDIAVTLSVGEWPREVYARWRDAGADRFLLKLETADPALYQRLQLGQP